MMRALIEVIDKAFALNDSGPVFASLHKCSERLMADVNKLTTMFPALCRGVDGVDGTELNIFSLSLERAGRRVYLDVVDMPKPKGWRPATFAERMDENERAGLYIDDCKFFESGPDLVAELKLALGQAAEALDHAATCSLTGEAVERAMCLVARCRRLAGKE